MVEVAIEYIEAEVAHFRFGDAQRLHRLRDHSGRRRLVVIVVVLEHVKQDIYKSNLNFTSVTWC